MFTRHANNNTLFHPQLSIVDLPVVFGKVLPNFSGGGLAKGMKFVKIFVQLYNMIDMIIEVRKKGGCIIIPIVYDFDLSFPASRRYPLKSPWDLI